METTPTPVPYTTGATLLEITDVHLSLGGKSILRGVDGTIVDLADPVQDKTRGQVVGLLGPSGIGKTQLFRTIAGLQKPTKGSVKIGKEGIAPTPDKVGVVAQNYPLFEHLTVLQNLLLGLHKQKHMDKKEKRQRCEEMLERFGLRERRDYFPEELSGGQRQRVAIAQQLLCSKGLVLMDEPFSGLDPIMLQEVCELILEVANLDTENTIVVVTHDISAAVTVSDTLWLLGRDRDASGKIMHGARVQKTYNLLDLGLAWQDDLRDKPEFAQFVREVERKFAHL